MIGIYSIRNLINGRIYIGQSVNIDSRLLEHENCLNGNRHQNTHLQRAWNKYGKSNFEFSVVEECSEIELDKKEQYWIDYYGGINSVNTYNQKGGGSHGKLSSQTKQKISKKQKGIPKKPGRKVSEEGRKKLSLCHRGILHSYETIQKMSESRKGRKQTEKTKLKIKQANKQRYIDNPELREQISERMKGRIVSEETRKKIGEKSRGRKYGKETSKKHSESLKKAYAEGRKKTVKITVGKVTKTQSEWAELLNIAPSSLIYQRKKGTVEKYIESLLNQRR